MVHPESVAKILGSLDISKAMGPDGVHPRLLRYLQIELSCGTIVSKLYLIHKPSQKPKYKNLNLI